MILRNLRIRAGRGSILSDAIGLYGMIRPEKDGKPQIVAPALVTETEYGWEVPPFMHLTPDQAQELMDSLWECGLRPTEGTGSAGAMAAVQRHLEDMRRLVFDQKGSE